MDDISFPVESVLVMLFARAVGESDPIYWDQDHAAASPFGGVIAPPTFTQVLQQFIPDYVLRPDFKRPWIGSGATPTGIEAAEISANTLHAEQHFEYLKPIVVGDILTAATRPGGSWEKTGSSGVLRFSEVITDFRNQEGELVLRSTLVAVETARPGSDGNAE
jgi:peroxisomal enoyl-CoA hydratase 2